jgi:flagellin
MRELSIQAASDTVGDTERGFINQEVTALKSEVERISKTTRFNGTELLSGEGPKLEFQVGIGSSPERDRIQYDVAKANSKLSYLGVEDASTATKENAQQNLDKIDRAINLVNENRANFGALQNRLQSTMNNLLVSDENMSAANSRIRDADIAAESAELTKRNILMNAAVATLTQANQNSMLALKLI